MEKIEIAKNELYITNLTRVVKSYILRGVAGTNTPRAYDGFILITKGKCRYDFTDGASFTAREGDLLYLAKRDVYKMTIDCDRYEFIFCDFDFVSDNIRKSAVYRLRNFNESVIVFDKMLVCFESKREGYLSECLSYVYATYTKAIKSAQNYSSVPARSIANKAQNFILKNLSNSKLSVAQTAKELGVSETHLRRIFTSVFSTSPAKYICNARVLRAKELIALDYLTLSDVAEQCGFSSYPYFCKTFKAITGQTPASYKRSTL